MYNMSMYICICVLSTVGTGALICCIKNYYCVIFVILNKKRGKKIIKFVPLILGIPKDAVYTNYIYIIF